MRAVDLDVDIVVDLDGDGNVEVFQAMAADPRQFYEVLMRWPVRQAKPGQGERDVAKQH